MAFVDVATCVDLVIQSTLGVLRCLVELVSPAAGVQVGLARYQDYLGCQPLAALLL